MKIIYIIVENYNRELIGKLYLSMNLANSLDNYKIIIGEKNKIRKLLNFAPSGIIIEKGMRKGLIESLKKYKKKNHKIFLIDEEAITYVNDNFYFKRNIDEGIENYVDLFLATGERHKKTLIKKINKNKISVIGNLRFDIKKKTYSNIYKDIVIENKKKYGKFFLINSRFGHINKNSAYRIKFDQSYYKSSLKIYKHFLKLPQKISLLYKNNKVILRPHPSENILTWVNKYTKKKNIVVIYKNNVVPWILGSKKIYQNRCTTALDAFFLRKSVINFDPYKSKFEHKKLFSILGKKSHKIKVNEKKIIKNYVENFFTHDASAKLVKIIKKIKLEKNKSYSMILFLILVKLDILVENLKKIFSKNNQDYKNYTKQKIGENNELFITKMFDKMKKEYSDKKKLSISFFSPDIFIIEKKI